MQTALMQNHLDACGECRAKVHRLKAAQHQLRANLEDSVGVSEPLSALCNIRVRAAAAPPNPGSALLRWMLDQWVRNRYFGL